MADVDGSVVSSVGPAGAGDSQLEYIAVDGSVVHLPQVIVTPPDTTPPTVSNFTPTQGTGIESTQVISFDVTDETSIAAVVVLASYPDGTIEVVHDNDGFRGNFVGGSNSRTAIAGGYTYQILRNGGWEQAPTIEFIPIDTGGNIGVIA